MGGGANQEPWHVELTTGADRDLDQLPGPEKSEVRSLLQELEEDPFLPGVEKLRHYNNRYKIRFGRGERYRLIYDAYLASRKVLVLLIEERRPETYSGMDRW
jgi:mRNA-degrading endonuclease RelE of RelBE toxin-antitoxin system